MTCKFCEETRRKLAALVDAWARSRIGVSHQQATEIDHYFREQYRIVSNEDDPHGDNHGNQT